MSKKSSFETTKSAPGNTGGRLVASVIGLFFIAIGSIFVVIIAQQSLASIDSYFWKSTPAVIENIFIERKLSKKGNDTPYYLRVQYQYEFDGQSYQSEALRLSSGGYETYDDAYLQAKPYYEDKNTTCYVNPRSPSEAILRRDSPWFSLLVLFPLIFVIVGLGILYASWFLLNKEKSQEPQSLIQNSKKQRSSGIGLKIVGLVLLSVGGLIFYALSGELIDQFRSQSWKQHSARVLATAVLRSESSNDDGGTHYSYIPDIYFEYSWKGKTFYSSRYRFMGTSFSKRSDAKREIRKRPVGSEIQIFLNSKDPTEVVIDNSLSAYAFLYLFPLIFVWIGIYMIFYKEKQEDRTERLEPTTAPESRPVEGQVVLEPTTSKQVQFWGLLFIALFWNAFIAFAISSGEINSIIAMLFLSPFLLVGLGLLAATAYSFLSLFNPTVTIIANSAVLRPGQTAHFQWEIKGRAGLIKQLSICLEGEERATYTEGTDTKTSTNTFARYELYRGGAHISRGEMTFDTPQDILHSFEAPHNRINWNLKVHGQIDWWPDSIAEYRLKVAAV